MPLSLTLWSAVVTDERRHPTSWPSSWCDIRRRMLIPSGVTRPQRSARCQKRLVDRHAQRAPDGALQEHRHHLRPSGERASEGVVEDGEARGGQDMPEDAVADEPVVG
jgi:hypothetical protein